MKVFCPFPENYELIDAGGGRKLERWGTVITIRPELQAYFKAALPDKEWNQLADWEFIPQAPASLQGSWKKRKSDAPQSWELPIGNATFLLQLTSNKHLGLFPEQEVNWQYITRVLDPTKRFLNAFAYTGAASIFGKLTGAEVLHCDSMKGMLDWGRKNMELSQLSDIKWVLEDALKFISREVKRGNKYDLVQMDPPAWGLGAKGEKWKLEDLLPSLLEQALYLLNDNGELILNTYSPKVTIHKLDFILKNINATYAQVNHQELWMKASSGKELYFGIITRVKRSF